MIYGMFGIVLLGACFWKGRALLQVLLEAAFEGLSDEGWLQAVAQLGLLLPRRWPC